MASNLEQAASSLQAHCDQLASEVASDTESLKLKKDKLKEYVGLLEKLHASPAKAKTAKGKPSADKATTLAAAIAELTENAPQSVPGDDLKALVQDRLRKQGFGLTGVFKYWDKSLADAEAIIETEPGVYGLAQAKVSEVA